MLIFELYDTNHDGHVNVLEMQEVLREVYGSRHGRPEEARAMVQKHAAKTRAESPGPAGAGGDEEEGILKSDFVAFCKEHRGLLLPAFQLQARGVRVLCVALCLLCCFAARYAADPPAPPHPPCLPAQKIMREKLFTMAYWEAATEQVRPVPGQPAASPSGASPAPAPCQALTPTTPPCPPHPPSALQYRSPPAWRPRTRGTSGCCCPC